MTSLDKEYIAEIKVGIKTDTGDITGNVIEVKNKAISKSDVEKVFVEFPKKYLQTVPKYSAVKINGKKLYEYARENIEVELPKREVNIYSLELIEFNEDIIKFRTHVSSLVRTKQGKFDISDAKTLEEIEKNSLKGKNIHEFLDYPCVNINDNEIKKVVNGGKIKNNYNIKDKVILMRDNVDLAIYEVDGETLKPFIMF